MCIRDRDDIDDAEARLLRFAPYIASAFPETAKTGGIIESKLIPIPKMKESLEKSLGKFGGKLFLKCDSHLPISGSIKAVSYTHLDVYKRQLSASMVDLVITLSERGWLLLDSL